MASISRDKSGNRTIQVVCADGKRRSIRLGKMSQRVALEVKTKVAGAQHSQYRRNQSGQGNGRVGRRTRFCAV